MTNKINQAISELNTTLKNFMPHRQTQTLKSALNGDEAERFADIILELSERIKSMPKMYETDGQGRNVLAQLHYFVNNYDAYIVEKDAIDDQQQAFGWASFGYGYEAGYVSISEILELAELDLYFTPQPIKNVIKEG